MNRSVFGPAWRLVAAILVLSWLPEARALTISEIMYAPSNGGVEYIEIYNEDVEARDLSHYHFTRGITYQFSGFETGASVFIRGRSFLVVASDPEKLMALYPHLENVDENFPVVVGPFVGSLDNAGETISLANPGGAVDAEVSYNNRGGWPSAADGAGHSLILKNPDLDDAGDNDNWTFSPLMGGSPGTANLGETVFLESGVIDPGEVWQFFRGTLEPSDPREAWRQPEFDASAWEAGPAPIGFGTPTDVCFAGTQIDGMDGVYLSMYFRKSFQVPDPSVVDVLLLRMGVDDGFIAYLNGKEIARRNMNNGDAFDARASASSECSARTEFEIVDPVGKQLLVAGTNVLCIQVHNAALVNNDFGMVPELIAKEGKDIGRAGRVDVDLNELLWNTESPDDAWLELHNDQDTEQDISGFFLSDDPVVLKKLEFPPGTRLLPRGFLVVTNAQMEAAGILLHQLADRTKFLALSRTLPGQPPETSTQVVDAYRFQIGSSLRTLGMSDARYPDGNDDWVIAREPTRGAANKLQVQRDVVINEVMYHPFHPFNNAFVPGTGGFEKPEDQGEYIELFNRGDAPVDLSGWAFTRGVEFEFPPGTSLAPKAFLVLARDPAYIRAHYELPAAQVLGPWYNVRSDSQNNTVMDTAALADAGERLELEDQFGNAAEAFRWADNHRWSQWADTRGSSLERLDPFHATNRPSNWDSSDESIKSQWKRYSYRARYTESEKELQIMLLTRGIVLIDNLSVTDPATPGGPNFIQGGDFEAPLGVNWNLDGTHIHSGRTTLDKKDGEACLKIIATGRGNNRIDRIRVANPAFPVNRELLLEFDAKWICGEGTLMFTGTWNTFARRLFLEVPQKLGTPGRENSIRARLNGGNLGPLVERVDQLPVLPSPTEDVVVTAEVTDPDGVKDVKLKFSIDSVRAAITELAMLDDGQGPDRRAGDGTYTATVPRQPVGRRVVFSIHAADEAGNVGRFPYDDRMRTHPYLLDPATEDVTKLRYAVYIHAVPGAAGAVPEYRMLLTGETTSYLNTRHTMNNDVVDSSFVWNNSKIWYNVGVRHGNSPWTRPGGRSFVVKLPREDELQGYKKFKLDNRGSEINERVVYYLIRSQNVPGRDPVPFGRSTYARPILNAGPVGVFERVEIPGKQFVDRWWPNDSEGVIYKVDDKFLVNLPQGNHRANRDAFIRYPPEGSGQGNGEDEEEYRWYFLHRSREKYDDFSELIQLAKFFSQAPAATYEKEIFDRVNVEAMIRTLAVEINVDDWDTWGTNRGKNCYIYRPRIDGRWTLIGWDKDLTFGNPGGLPLVPGMFPESARLLNSTGGRKVYHSVIGDMLENFYKADYLNLFFGQHGRDRNNKVIAGVPGSAVAQAGFLTSRAQTMRSVVPANQPAFSLVTGGAAGEIAVDAATLAVEGTGPLKLWRVEVTNPLWGIGVDGNPKRVVMDVNRGELSFATTTRWKTVAPIDLERGVNDLTFSGYDSEGVLLGTDLLRAVFNAGWGAPRVVAIEPGSGPSVGGTAVVVSGLDFHVGAKVFIGGAAAQVIRVDETAGTISAVTPPGTGGPAEVKVQNLDGQSGVLAGGFTYGGARFNRGDVNHDGSVNLTDVINILGYQFFAGTLPCLDAADVNDDGAINVTDVIVHLGYQFFAGEPPSAPFDPAGSQAGEDPTQGDALTCVEGR